MDPDIAAWNRLFDAWNVQHPGWKVRTYGPTMVRSLTLEGEPDGFLVEVVNAQTGGRIEGVGEGPEAALADASRQIRRG